MTVNGTAKRWNGSAWEYVGQLPLAHQHALADVTSLAALPPRGVRRATSFLRSDPCATRTQWPGTGGLSNGTDTYGNYRSLHSLVDTAASDLRLVYTNAYSH